MPSSVLRRAFLRFAASESGRGATMEARLALGLVVVAMEDLRQALAHVPLDVIGQHMEKEMGADPGRAPVKEGPDLQVDGLEGAEGALDPGQGFVAAHLFLCMCHST